MTRPVICLAPRQWDFQHPVDITAVQLAAKFALEGIVDYELPDPLVSDIRLCRTQWPQKVCSCRAYILEWHTKDRRTLP